MIFSSVIIRANQNNIHTKLPMEKNLTIFKPTKTTKTELPRKNIIDTLLNYSKSVEVVKNRFGVFVLVNN